MDDEGNCYNILNTFVARFFPFPQKEVIQYLDKKCLENSSKVTVSRLSHHRN